MDDARIAGDRADSGSGRMCHPKAERHHGATNSQDIPLDELRLTSKVINLAINGDELDLLLQVQ